MLDTTENRQLSEITYIRTENTHAFPLPQNLLAQNPPLRHLSPFFHNFSLRFFYLFHDLKSFKNFSKNYLVKDFKKYLVVEFYQFK